MKKTIITAFAAMLLCIPSFSTETTSSDEAKESKKKKEVTYNEKGEIIKTGLNFGPLPVVAFDADRGLIYTISVTEVHTRTRSHGGTSRHQHIQKEHGTYT